MKIFSLILPSVLQSAGTVASLDEAGLLSAVVAPIGGMVLIPLVVYLIAINVATFAAFVRDKWLARHHRWRIRESTLLLLSLAGGALGGLIAMRAVRHKTTVRRFTIGLPCMVVLHIVLLVGLRLGGVL